MVKFAEVTQVKMVKQETVPWGDNETFQKAAQKGKQLNFLGHWRDSPGSFWEAILTECSRTHWKPDEVPKELRKPFAGVKEAPWKSHTPQEQEGSKA